MLDSGAEIAFQHMRKNGNGQNYVGSVPAALWDVYGIQMRCGLMGTICLMHTIYCQARSYPG